MSTTPARSTARDAEARPDTGAGAALLSPVEGRLQRILADVDFPAISNDALEALKEVPDDESSIQRLANIVLREYALTVKVLRTANSAHYRRTDKHIRSAAHAMLLLGAGTVRHLAASLLLFEHYRKRSPGLKELMLLSLLTANHARELALLRGLPDPEEANLCGMFRNLGEVLVAAYFPRDYARILQAMEQRGCGQAAAAFEVLGFPYEALGEAMRVGARHRGMCHPELLAGPAFELWAGSGRLAEQRPLHAERGSVGAREIGRHVPPLDAKLRMRSVISGKDEMLAGHDLCKAVCGLAKPGIALRARMAGEAERKRRAQERAARERAASVH